MKFRSFKLFGLALLGLGLVGSLGPGRAQGCDVTIYSGESIQTAIDSFSAGAVICLAEGSWQEDLTVTKDNLILRGQGPSRSLVTGSLSIQVAGQFTLEGLTLQSSAAAAVVSGMTLIPAAAFQMGDSFGEGDSGERPVHTVYVSAFYMDKYEVTKAFWDEVASWAGVNGYDIGPGSGSGNGADYPVTDVSWYEVVKWANARSEIEGLKPCYYTDSTQETVYRTERVNVATESAKWSGCGYRLPTEAEWEKGARGSLSGQRYPWGNEIDCTKANYYDCVGEASEVGSYPPNGYGLYDMAGNVWEWVWDWYDSGYYSSSALSDPRGPASGSNRVLRGGGWQFLADSCRVAYRNYFSPDDESSTFGFRLARTAP